VNTAPLEEFCAHWQQIGARVSDALLNSKREALKVISRGHTPHTLPTVRTPAARRVLLHVQHRARGTLTTEQLCEVWSLYLYALELGEHEEAAQLLELLTPKHTHSRTQQHSDSWTVPLLRLRLENTRANAPPVARALTHSGAPPD
jgi:hypothetical protein